MKASNATQYAVIEAIIEVIKESDGGDITQTQVLMQDDIVEVYIQQNNYRIVPSNGLMLEHNGRGIRHVKYAPSKSVALLYEKVGETIYITFDDHAPVKYHRAIRCFCQLRAGQNAFPLRGRTSRRTVKLLNELGKRKSAWFDPKKRNLR